MDTKSSLKLSGSRHAQGVLRGLDPSVSLVIDERVEMATGGPQNHTGTVESGGNSIIRVEALEGK